MQGYIAIHTPVQKDILYALWTTSFRWKQAFRTAKMVGNKVKQETVFADLYFAISYYTEIMKLS